MVSSDEEGEEFPENVSQYHFEDDKREPISFDVLPVCWNTSETVQGSGKTIYVCGKADNGLSELFKPVKAWKFDITGQKPEISVLSGKKWIKLQKPRVSYEAFSRTVLITVNFLHLLKRNPELYGKDLWDKLSKILRLPDDRPSPDDLVDHKALIEKAVEHDDSLRKSKYLVACLVKNLHKKNKDQENARGKGKNAFIVDDDVLEECGFVAGKDGSSDREDGLGDEEDDDDDMFDSVCSICDEGGSILCCDGICMRSFHATPRAAREADSKCISLGFTSKEVEAMQTFKCQNCQHKLHQCYSCGKLGSSDKESGAAEVFQCVNATCGYFYHPGCVANRLHRDNEDASKALQKNIAAGELFTCPLHICFVCRQPEDKTDSELRMAVCRRCPKAYHKKCLPRKIAFEDDEDAGNVQRAWDNLLADRILIYCLKHEIDEDLGTPPRNHIKFPGDDKKESQSFTQRLIKHKDALKNKKPSMGRSRLGPALEPRRTFLENNPCKADRKICNSKGTETLRNMSFEKKSVSTKVDLKSPEQLDLVKPKTFGKHAVKKSVVKLDSDSETRILEIIKAASSRITLDDVIAKHEKLISSHAYKQKMDPCKNITRGKVEGFCKAVRAATVKLDGGGSIEDAKAICVPKILDQVVKWKSKLKVYLAPFIYGMRYTSFGRHFTNKDKLREIVEKIHWYVKSNDTVVDFCCGANDFSCFMKEKLESMGKTCNYKNYDRFPPKNDFSFEIRDWMTVHPKELPDGSKLIMGLNPPFGVKASLANQFINKALEFKPKLLVLIVPEETERLDKKKTPYDLIWEDRGKLSGKSFYLPGSIDVNDNQMDDWNVKPPILYLWSRSDWTARHMDVANKHGHRHEGEREGNHANRHPNRPVPERSSEKFDLVAETKADDVSVFPGEAERHKERSAGEKQTAPKDHPESKKVNGNPRRKRHSEEIHAKEDNMLSREYKHHRSSPFDPHEGWPHQVPVNARDANISPPLRYQRSPSGNLDIIDPSQLPFEPTSYGDGTYSRKSQPHGFGHDYFYPSTIYGGIQSGCPRTGGHDDRVGIHTSQMDVRPGGRYSVDVGPNVDYPLRVTPTLPDYSSRIPGEWTPTYMSEPEQRFRQSAFSSETDHRMTPVPGMDEYDHRFRDANHVRMSGFDPHLGHPSRPGLYNQAQRQGYPSGPMGFASRPTGPFHHPHGSSGSGGWIDE